MNKTKKELYEENKRYKEQQEIYSDFWETDAIKEYKKAFHFTKNTIIIIVIILLIISSFLLGVSI